MSELVHFWSKEHGILTAVITVPAYYNYAWICAKCGEIYLRRFVAGRPWIAASTSHDACQSCEPRAYYQPRRFEDQYNVSQIDPDLAAVEFFFNTARSLNVK